MCYLFIIVSRQALNDVAAWRQKYESNDSAVNPEGEEVRKKLSLRLSDCEAKLSASQAKVNALEKVNSKLQQEAEALVAELDKVRQCQLLRYDCHLADRYANN